MEIKKKKIWNISTQSSNLILSTLFDTFSTLTLLKIMDFPWFEFHNYVLFLVLLKPHGIVRIRKALPQTLALMIPHCLAQGSFNSNFAESQFSIL